MIRVMSSTLRRIAFVGFCLAVVAVCTQCGSSEKQKALPPADSDNGKLTLPGGFEALVVVDSIGRARHLAVNDNGDIYVKLRAVTPKGGNVALRDVDGDGKADSIKYFGKYADPGAYGTGMRIYNGYIYYSTTGEVYRSKLMPGQLLPDTTEELVVVDDYRSRPYGTEHIAKALAFDRKGHLYVSFGAPGDCCQVENRVPNSPGQNPCPQLAIHGGVWQFDANKLNQTQQDGKRYATGIRSIVGMDWNDVDDNLYAMQHGRDDLARTWSKYYRPWHNALLPSEEFFRVTEGMHGGWPYYYYDQLQGKKLLNPEYGGGDGKRADGVDSVSLPVIGFPGHFAPNAVLFYKGDQFPARYKNGAFIAFHGSTIRAPYPQGGYFIAFAPFKNGKATGEWEVFADGFAQLDTIVTTPDAKARPVGLAEGPDGSIYISESVRGKIWRIMYKGDREAFGEQQLAEMAERKKNRTNIKDPDEVNDDLLKGKPAIGAVDYNKYCASCHMPLGQGDGNRYPPVAGSEWVRDKQKVVEVLVKGLSGPITVRRRQYDGVMPAHDFLTDKQMADIITYMRTSMTHGGSGISEEEVRMIRSQLK